MDNKNLKGDCSRVFKELMESPEFGVRYVRYSFILNLAILLFMSHEFNANLLGKIFLSFTAALMFTLFAFIIPTLILVTLVHFAGHMLKNEERRKEMRSMRLEEIISSRISVYWATLLGNILAWIIHAFAKLCHEQNIGQYFTKPRTPQTNGKAERVIKTLMDMWHSQTQFVGRKHRRVALNRFVNYYNTAKPHKGINGFTPYELLEEFFYQQNV